MSGEKRVRKYPELVHPGDVLLEMIYEKGLTIRDFAKLMHYSNSSLHRLLNSDDGRFPPKFIKNAAEVLGTDAQFWGGLWHEYMEGRKIIESGKKLPYRGAGKLEELKVAVKQFLPGHLFRYFRFRQNQQVRHIGDTRRKIAEMPLVVVGRFIYETVDDNDKALYERFYACRIIKLNGDTEVAYFSEKELMSKEDYEKMRAEERIKQPE